MIMCAVIAIFAYLIVLVWQKRRRRGRLFNVKSVSAAALAVYYYMLVLYTIVFRPVYSKPRYHLELFWSYRKAINGSGYLFYEIVLNYILLMPVGLLVPVFRKKHSFRFTVLAGFLTSAFIECSQMVLKRGLFEFDDIIGNVFGVVMGYGIYLLLRRCFMKNTSND